MKILVAVTPGTWRNADDRALRWVGRAGYELKIFVPRNKLNKYRGVIDNLNYHWYLALTYKDLESHLAPEEYALENSFDLLLTIPDELLSWRKRQRFKDWEIKTYVEAVGKARLEFSRKPRKRIHRWANGATMRRIK